VRAITPITGAEPGYLRFPVRLGNSRVERRERADLGIVHGYPHRLDELPELRDWLVGQEKLPGSRELQHNLITLPTHSLLDDDDLQKLSAWLVDGI
jgi:dTDP-4-amino-4,6-dideoxygalactose transaminase